MVKSEINPQITVLDFVYLKIFQTKKLFKLLLIDFNILEQEMYFNITD